MKYLVGNAQHVGKREEQQDFFAFSDPGNQSFVRHGGLLGFVADGMGGMAYGREAGEIAVRTFLRSYEAKSPSESIPVKLKSALIQANQAVLTLVRQKGMAKGEVGTTLSAAVIHEGDLHWVSVGDSRIYLYRGGKLFQVTESHTIGNQLDKQAAAGKISREEALNNREREVLSCYLGIDELPEIDISVKPYLLQADDRVIISSDGLFDTLSDEEIAAGMQEDLQASCERLVQKTLAKDNPRQDNITIIAMGVDKTAPVYTADTKKKVKKKKIPLLFWVIILLLLVLIVVVGVSWLKP